MRTILLACAFALASVSAAMAEEEAKPQHLESQTDIGGVVGSGKFGHRWMTRTLLNINDRENSFEAHYGLAWEPRHRLAFDLTGGYAYTDEGVDAGHAFIIGTTGRVEFFDRKLLLMAEGQHRVDDGYRYDGFYSVDYAVVGVHLLNRGEELAAGFQFGSGHGLLPFRVDLRISFGVTDGMPDRASRFVLSFDFR